MENLLAPTLIACYGGISTTKLGLIIKKREPLRTFLHIHYFDKLSALLLGLTLKNMLSDVYILRNSRCKIIFRWLFSLAIYQIEQDTNEKGKQVNTKQVSRKQAKIKKNNIERVSISI